MFQRFTQLMMMCVFSCCLAAPALAGEDDKTPTVDELLQLEDDQLAEKLPAFFASLDETPPPVEELYPLLNHLQSKVAAYYAESKEATANVGAVRKWDVQSDFRKLFNEMVKRVPDEGLEKLCKTYADIILSPMREMDSYYFAPEENMFLTLSSRWIERELALIASEKRSAKMAPSLKPIPKEIANLPAFQKQWWLNYEGAMEPYRRTFESEKFLAKEKVIYFSNKDAFYTSIGDLLLKRKKLVAEDFAKFEWGGDCGMGSEELFIPRYRAMLMALLIERRLEEAIGLAPREIYLGMLGMGKPDAVFLNLLDTLHVDKETFLIGREVGGLLTKSHNFVDPGVRILLMYGGNRGISYVTSLFETADSSYRYYRIKCLADLLDPIPEEERNNGSENTRWKSGIIREVPISEEEREKLVRALLAALQINENKNTLMEALNSVQSLREELWRPTLRPLLDHWSDNVVESAIKALRAYGEDVPEMVPRPSPRLQVFINGKPAASMKLGLRYTYLGGGFSEEAETDEDGVLKIPRDHFVEPAKKLESMELSATPSASGGQEHSATDEIDLHEQENPADGDTSEDEAWFKTDVSLPVRFDKPVPVHIQTGSLKLNFQYPSPLSGNRDVKLSISTKVDRESFGASLDYGFKALPLFEFQYLMPGTYSLTVIASGSAVWNGEVVVLPGGVSKVVALKKGTMVKTRFIAPDGTQVMGKLYKNGNPTHAHTDGDFEYGTIPSLESGNYEIRVSASAEEILEFEDFINYNQSSLDEARASRHKGAVVRFTITPSSPDVLDLGEIKLKPEVPLRK